MGIGDGLRSQVAYAPSTPYIHPLFVAEKFMIITPW